MLINKSDSLLFFKTNLKLYQEIGSLLRAKIQDSDYVFFCDVCEKVSRSISSKDWNLRNQIICQSCHHGGRIRHSYKVIQSVIEDFALPRRLIFEQITDFKKLIDLKFEGFRGVEYLGGDKTPGELYPLKEGLVEHQDMCSLSYDDQSYDLICSFDVLEHVYDINKALSEMYRVLSHGGSAVLTVPFYDNFNKTLKRADIVNDELIHFQPEHYHLNPVESSGALVFNDFGLDLFDMFYNAGFDVRLSLGANLENGFLPDCNSCLEYHSWNIVFVLFKR